MVVCEFKIEDEADLSDGELREAWSELLKDVLGRASTIGVRGDETVTVLAEVFSIDRALLSPVVSDSNDPVETEELIAQFLDRNAKNLEPLKSSLAKF